jgi:crotonobetainyl-CoA:carnitine CoA-transferase CaiB-like acyl-CoA transferase
MRIVFNTHHRGSLLPGPLSHIKVLDLSRVLAGPWASQILADLGADVIKVERPGVGDDARAWGPPFLKDAHGAYTREAGYYLAANRGKRSLTLSLDTADGQAIVRQLAAQSDVVLENFKVGTLDRFGLGYEALKAVNPRLIYCSITGFGQTGPKKSNPAYDFLIQAMGGMMSVTGERDDLPGGGPQKVGIPIIDLITGVYSSVAILAALAGREVSGKGDYIDIGMLDVQVGLLSNQAMNYLVAGRTPKRTGNAHPNIQPQKVFACRDGDIVLVIGNDAQFEKLCEVLGFPALSRDERFATNPARVKHQDVLSPQLDQAFARETREHWVARLTEAGVPCGPINTIPEVFDDPQVKAREMLRHLPHPSGTLAPQVASPFRFRNASVEYKNPPPLLGQHSDEVLHELGMDDAKIAQLRERGVV